MESPRGTFAAAETPELGDDHRAMLRSHEYLSEGEMESRLRELADNEPLPDGPSGRPDGGKGQRPRPEVTLRSVRFSLLVLLSVGVIGGVTAVFWNGIRVDSVNEPVGSSERSERKLDRYNTYSGVVMGVVETAIGLGLANFFPVFTVYVHNLKWFPGDDPAVKVSKAKKLGVMVFFPLLMVAFGNSFTALQAGASTQSSDLLLTPADLNASAASTTSTNASALLADIDSSARRTLRSPIQSLEQTLLRSAVQRRAAPFAYPSASVCTKKLAQDPIIPRLAAIDSTNLIVGLPISEWSVEMYPETPLAVSDADLDLQLSFELAFQGQALMERTYGDVKPRYTCSESTGSSSSSSSSSSNSSSGSSSKGRNATLECWYSGSTRLPELQAFVNGSAQQSTQALHSAILDGIGAVFATAGYTSLNASTLSVTAQSFNLSSNMKARVLSVSVEFDRNQYYWLDGTRAVPEDCQGAACDFLYSFQYSGETCSATNCVFLDQWDATQPVPRHQALMTRYASRCPPSGLSFSFDVGAEVPADCEYASDAAFVYGHGSRLVGDEFGTSSDGEAADPYALNPRRELFFTFARLDWAFEDLGAKFDAACVLGDGRCLGMSHNLSSSGRFVLVGNDSLPPRLGEADLVSPIKLFELSSPQLKTYDRSTDSFTSAVMHRINASNFARVKTSRPLSGAECSVVAEAYMTQVEANHYWVEDPMQAALTAALLYVYQAGAVTSLFQESIPDSAFGKMAMSQDMLLSTIYVSNTDVGAAALWLGCGLVLLLAAVALLFPNERARLGPPLGSNIRAERFIDVQTEELYPNLVYKKRFLLGQEIKFREFAVESVTLHHKMEEEAQVRL